MKESFEVGHKEWGDKIHRHASKLWDIRHGILNRRQHHICSRLSKRTDTLSIKQRQSRGEEESNYELESQSGSNPQGLGGFGFDAADGLVLPTCQQIATVLKKTKAKTEQGQAKPSDRKIFVQVDDDHKKREIERYIHVRPRARLVLSKPAWHFLFVACSKCNRFRNRIIGA